MNEPEKYKIEPLICMTSLNILQKFSPPLSFAILFFVVPFDNHPLLLLPTLSLPVFPSYSG